MPRFWPPPRKSAPWRVTVRRKPPPCSSRLAISSNSPSRSGSIGSAAAIRKPARPGASAITRSMAATPGSRARPNNRPRQPAQANHREGDERPAPPRDLEDARAEHDARHGQRQDAKRGGPQKAPPAGAGQPGGEIDEVERDDRDEAEQQQRARAGRPALDAA